MKIPKTWFVRAGKLAENLYPKDERPGSDQLLVNLMVAAVTSGVVKNYNQPGPMPPGPLEEVQIPKGVQEAMRVTRKDFGPLIPWMRHAMSQGLDGAEKGLAMIQHQV